MTRRILKGGSEGDSAGRGRRVARRKQAWGTVASRRTNAPNARVNLDALWAYTSPSGEPRIAAIAKKPEKLKAALKGLDVTSPLCFYVTGKDQTGALLKVFRSLADANINIECLDALAVGGNPPQFSGSAARM